MGKPTKSSNAKKSNFKSRTSFKTPSKNVFRKGAINLKIKEKIKEKRATKTQQKFLKKEEEKIIRQKTHDEKSDAILQLKKKRLERTKIISKKTNRGQPLMKDRIQYLLSKIQEMKRN